MSKGEAEKGSGDPATEEEKKREEQADEAICSACEHSGIKVSSWDDFEAWGQYVEGQLDEPQLAETAEKEVTEFARVFGKYLVIDKEEPAHVRKELEKHERAGQANRIYRRVCREAGLTLCFFKDFDSWSEYVKGGLTDSEFHERVEQELRRMMVEGHSTNG